MTLVLIRGSNLDALVKQSVNLTDRGFQRHRILWVREMDEAELRKAGKGEPTIDRIEVAEFESHEELQEWLKKTAPSFVPRGAVRGEVAPEGLRYLQRHFFSGLPTALLAAHISRPASARRSRSCQQSLCPRPCS